MELALKEIYVLYADYALKNPFYELDMPIRCDLFSQGVDALIERLNTATLTTSTLSLSPTNTPYQQPIVRLK